MGRTATLVTLESGDQGSLSRLTGDGLDVWVMEPPWRGNRRCVSCIPAGRYVVAPHRSPSFGACRLVCQVPGRSHILIHAGNVGGDVAAGWHSHTEGCLLPGLRPGHLAVRGRRQRAVLTSRPAVSAIEDWAGDELFTLTIDRGGFSDA